MTQEPLSLHHRNLLFGPLRAIGTPVSEYSFANLYLFRQKHEYAVINDTEIFVRGKAYDKTPYVMPTRDLRSISKTLLDTIIQKHGMLFPVLEEWLPVFDPAHYTVTCDEAESDYINAISKLSDYKGRKLHGEKNLLNYFINHYFCRALPLTPERCADARKILDVWLSQVGLPPDETDYAACREAIALSEELALCGAIYYVGQAPVGFIMGE
ncbi:MAG: phosphatidylglycerol lysyltransferase domain-containing protein, partial [Chitinivibrionales bacterium]|nr:phosphatidylglycerol lysyltransferase domain-containing protein [Chitinivibrionales bacterium]